MGLFSAVFRAIPGFRHIAAGCTAAGVFWFAAFVVPLNFGILAPFAWPGDEARAVRVGLCGLAAFVLWASHRRATVMERLMRRRAARQAAEAREHPAHP